MLGTRRQLRPAKRDGVVSRRRTRVAARTRSGAALLAALAVLGTALPSSVAAEPRNSREYRLKAAFVYNFTKFIRWPDDAPAGKDDNVVLCTLSDKFVHQVMRDTVAGKPVRGNPIQVKALSGDADAEGCHLVFVSSSRRDRLDGIKKRVKPGGVLVVSEAGSFGQQIAMINLVVEENKVRFEIDTNATDEAGLRVSSKLLKLARIRDQ